MTGGAKSSISGQPHARPRARFTAVGAWFALIAACDGSAPTIRQVVRDLIATTTSSSGHRGTGCHQVTARSRVEPTLLDDGLVAFDLLGRRRSFSPPPSRRRTRDQGSRPAGETFEGRRPAKVTTSAVPISAHAPTSPRHGHEPPAHRRGRAASITESRECRPSQQRFRPASPKGRDARY